MTKTLPKKPFKFNSPEGWALCRQILLKRLPFGPHDYQLQGITSMLDGNNLLAISATGSGKSAYIYMLMHVILALLDDPTLCPTAKFPSKPAILAIYPTTALEEDQEQKMTQLGLTAKAVNAVTKGEAEKEGKNIWALVEHETNVILVSPEMLSTPGFTSLIASKKFQDRLFAMAIDEVHLLTSWGESFRPAYKQIMYVRARFAKHVVTFGMTATLRVGKHLQSVCGFLGWKDGTYQLLRRSNARPDVQLIFRTFNSTAGSERFPQLDWVLKTKGKTLIFCSSIRYGFKLAVYFWHLDPKSAVSYQNIRLFNSLNSPEYNRETLLMLMGNADSKITIATDKLLVGVDVSDFQTVIVIDPKDLDDLWQKGGRVGRDRTRVCNPQVITYIPSQVMKAARAFQASKVAANQPEDVSVGGTAKRKRVKDKNKEVEEDEDSGLYEVIMASCHVAEMNRQYDNPPFDSPCSEACGTCINSRTHSPSTMSESCNCSGCEPESLHPPPAKKVPRKQIPIHLRVTQEMRKVGKARLEEYREELWENADELTTGMMPARLFLPDYMIDSILDTFPTFLSKATISSLVSNTGQVTAIDDARKLLSPFIDANPTLSQRPHDLLEVLWKLHGQFDKMREEKKREAKAKREAKKSGSLSTMTSGPNDNGQTIDDEPEDEYAENDD